MRDFIERLKENRVIIADGAMGTMLYSKGVPRGHCFDELILSNPNIIKEIHRAYRDAGAEILETNTFGANYAVLDRYYDLGKEVRDINYYGAKLAREVAPDAFIAGSIGPITRPLDTSEKLSISDIERMFSQQITALLDGGVDLIILETMSDLEEALAGFRAARRVGDSPVIVSFSFSNEGRTITGLDPATVAERLKREGVRILGANCGSGPREVYRATQKMIDAPWLSAMPNAGLPKFVQGRFVYPHNPDYFAYYAKRFLSLGVSIIGGCCGTTPEHIRAISEAVKGREVMEKRRKVSLKDNLRVVQTERKITTSLKQKCKEKFLWIVEMETPKGADVKREIELAKKLSSLGIDVIAVSDTPMAIMRMGPLGLAHRIKEETGMDVILHKTTRDRNILGLQSDLLAAFSLGIDNILALTGDPPSAGDYPFSIAVYEVTSKGLIEMINSLNSGRDWLGNPLESPTGFWVGAASGIELTEVELSRVKAKIEAGAGFLMTQPVFDIEAFSKFVERIKEFKVPIFAGVMPLFSSQQAEYLHNEVPGISIPEDIRKRADKEGVEIARELINRLKNLTNGVCIMLPKSRYSILRELLHPEGAKGS